MSKNLEKNNCSIDLSNAIAAEVVGEDLYDVYYDKVAEIISKKEDLTFQVDCLVAEHKKKTKELKEITEKYLKLLGVEDNE